MDNYTRTRMNPNYDLTVSDNPYSHSVYDLSQIPTPPKPPHARNRLVLSLVMVIIALVIGIAGTVIALGYANRTTSVSSHDMQITVTAQSLVQDFIKHNLPIDQITYGTKLSQWSGYSGNITEQSSASFVDPSFCGGYGCGVGSVWLGVYLTSSDAQIVYHTFLTSQDGYVQETSMPHDKIFQFNRCLLIGEPSTSQFVQIVKNDCV